MTQETEARTTAGSLVEELQPLVKPMPGHFRIRWFEARDVIERREAAWQADRDRLQAEFDKARASERALRRERNGEVWYYQGDEYDHIESLTCPVLIEAEDLRGIVGERDALSDFKSYVHTRLDEAGIPSDRDDPHSAEGCMIGDRLDLLVGERDSLNTQWAESESILDAVVEERDRLRTRITELEHQADERNAGYDVLFRSCEAHRERADRCEGVLVAEQQAIGNLLARIFGDGGHRQQAIGDLTAACAEAESVVLAERQPLVDLRAAVNKLVDELNDDYCIMQYAEIAERLAALLAASSPGAGGAVEEEGSVGA